MADSPSRSALWDFVAGVDPTGTKTFQYGMEDARRGQTSGLRRGIGTAGGVIGGAAVVPGVIGALIGGGGALLEGRRGVRNILRGVGEGAWLGAKHPYEKLYSGYRGYRALRAAANKQHLSDKQIGHLESMVRDTSPVYLPEGKLAPEYVRMAVKRMKPAQLEEARDIVAQQVRQHGSLMGLSGAVTGGSAYLQYGKGGETGRTLKKHQIPIKDILPQEKTGAEEESGMPGWLLPLLGAGLGGAGALGLAARRYRAPVGSVLEKIQQKAGGKFVRSDPDMLGITKDTSPAMKKLKRLLYGPTVAEESIQAGRGAVWNRDAPHDIKGVFNPALGAGNRQMGKSELVDKMEDKLREAVLLQKHAPGTSPKTVDIQKLLMKHKVDLHPKNREAGLRRLREVLEKELGPEYILKTREHGKTVGGGVMSSGVFPTEKTDLADVYRQWKKMRPGFVKEVGGDEGLGLVNAIKKYRTRPGFEGRVIEDIMQGNAIAQQRLPLKGHGVMSPLIKRMGQSPTKEFRVHVIGGQAVPFMAQPRYFRPTPGYLKDYMEARRAARWTQKNVLDKLPKQYQGMSYGVDVAPLARGAKGKHPYQVIELNTGGSSGLLDTPMGSHNLHRAITGKYDPAALAAIGTAGTVGGAGLGAGVSALTD